MRSHVKEYIRVNRAMEERFMPLVQKAIHAKVKKVIEKLRSGGVTAAQNYLHMDLGNEEMTQVIQDLYLTVGKKHAKLNYSRLLHQTRRRKFVDLELQTKGFGFNAQWADYIINYLKRFLTSKITFKIAETTRDALIRALTAMTLEGLSVDLTIERLEDWPFERFQAARIVRTEVNRASNVGAQAQAQTSPWQQNKEWISIHDNRTRGNPITGKDDDANHWALDGVTIDEEDEFTDPRNGDRLAFPGDPTASAASVINCRCQLGFSFKRDKDGNLIPKRKTTAVIFPGQIPKPRIITIQPR